MPDKIRVLHVVPDIGHGGAEHQLLANVSRLDQSRFESYICQFRTNADLTEALTPPGVKVIDASSTGRFSWLRTFIKMVRIIRSKKIDIVHTSNVRGEIYGGLAAKLTMRPAVATLTNIAYSDVWLEDNPHLNRFKLRLMTCNRKLMLRFFHKRYIAISDFVRQSTVDGFGLDSKKIELIFRGIESEPPGTNVANSNRIREELGIRQDQFLMLNVGRLVPQKGQRYLLDAVADLKTRFDDFCLLIVGVGYLERTLKEQASELGVADKVRFLGRRDDVPELLKAADVFVFPSLFEGLGVALLEATAAGKACVASDTGPIPEIVIDNETGLLFPSRDHIGMTVALERLARDPEFRSKLGLAAHERTTSKFSIDESVRKLESVYTSIAAS